MNTAYLRKKIQVEESVCKMNRLKQDAEGFTTRESELLKLGEFFMNDLLQSCGTVKIGFTSQKPIQVGVYIYRCIIVSVNNTLLKLQRRATTYKHDSDTLFFPCQMRHTPEIGKLMETFCFRNLKELNLKISEDRHEFYHLLKKNSDGETWDDWSMCIKQIVHHASQLSKNILEKPQDEWKDSYLKELFPKKLGEIPLADLTSIIKTSSDDNIAQNKKCKIVCRQSGSGFYPDDYIKSAKHTNLEAMFNIKTTCLITLGKHIANAIRIDLQGKQSYTVVIIGCVGSPLNTINLCVSVLNFLRTKDAKVQFHIYETNVQKYNEGIY